MKVKRIISSLLCAAITLAVVPAISACGNKRIKLDTSVLNYSNYSSLAVGVQGETSSQKTRTVTEASSATSFSYVAFADDDTVKHQLYGIEESGAAEKLQYESEESKSFIDTHTVYAYANSERFFMVNYVRYPINWDNMDNYVLVMDKQTGKVYDISSYYDVNHLIYFERQKLVGAGTDSFIINDMSAGDYFALRRFTLKNGILKEVEIFNDFRLQQIVGCSPFYECDKYGNLLCLNQNTLYVGYTFEVIGYVTTENRLKLIEDGKKAFLGENGIVYSEETIAESKEKKGDEEQPTIKKQLNSAGEWEDAEFFPQDKTLFSNSLQAYNPQLNRFDQNSKVTYLMSENNVDYYYLKN